MKTHTSNLLMIILVLLLNSTFQIKVRQATTKKELNGTCSNNKDCHSNYCVNSKCKQGNDGPGKRVDHRNQCRSNSVDSNNICLKSDLNSKCAFHSDCISDNCQSSICFKQGTTPPLNLPKPPNMFPPLDQGRVESKCPMVNATAPTICCPKEKSCVRSFNAWTCS